MPALGPSFGVAPSGTWMYADDGMHGSVDVIPAGRLCHRGPQLSRGVAGVVMPKVQTFDAFLQRIGQVLVGLVLVVERSEATAVSGYYPGMQDAATWRHLHV